MLQAGEPRQRTGSPSGATRVLKHGSVGLPIPGCGGYLDASPVKQQVSFVNLRCSRYIACCLRESCH
ncbi:hypothetical protein NIES2130_16805 [Scytonema sp. HK-05]|nr:hypothetical protein NIES2130_16805 [Scytonema sp. HK-05]